MVGIVYNARLGMGMGGERPRRKYRILKPLLPRPAPYRPRGTWTRETTVSLPSQHDTRERERTTVR